MPTTRRRPRPQQAMLDHITGYWVSQMIFVAAKLGIADVLAKGPKTPAAVAEQVGAHAPFVHRVLRTLASLGVLAETSNGRFRLTPTGATLRSGVPGSLRDFAIMMVSDHCWRGWGALLHGVRTGDVGFDHVFGQRFFDYLVAHPDKEQEFAASMASISGAENDAVARAYGFGRFGRLVDVGGAHGHLLATVLRRHRKLRGVLYDQPQVVAGAAASGFLAGLESRVEVAGGDFFASVPTGADAYMMKYILHDWDDERCKTILALCRDAVAPGGRVLVVENVIEPGNRPSWGKLLDVNMLALLTGKERTKAEFKDLFARAGLRLRRVYPTASPISIVEATAA
ncbi:MAG: methyltransferase [Candidatus Rokuibacteriota bacterium]